jgi:AcrR family transcriptional regulator
MKRSDRGMTGEFAAMGSTAEMAARQPQQDRGQRRIDAVLDAAAALVTESGLESVTMQAIGKRSGTSAGSLYHFFPDRKSVLRALTARHVEALRERLHDARRIDAGALGQLSTEQRVDHFVLPLLDHIAAHPDFLAVTHADALACPTTPRDVDLEQVVMEAAEQLVLSCDPAATPATCAARATMLRAAVEGMLGHAARPAAPSYPSLVRELKAMLSEYLAATARR